jgi:hypothetical protein
MLQSVNGLPLKRRLLPKMLACMRQLAQLLTDAKV